MSSSISIEANGKGFLTKIAMRKIKIAVSKEMSKQNSAISILKEARLRKKALK